MMTYSEAANSPDYMTYHTRPQQKGDTVGIIFIQYVNGHTQMEWMNDDGDQMLGNSELFID